jgi:tRNA/tmRNA/rRNA uracil-C5-methylase (TrmA/RlmC/RlmD family)
MFSVPAGITLAKALNFLIIRGDYESQGLIFNVRKTGADIVRQCTAIAESLREKHANLSSAFIFHDPEGSRYYLNSSPETDDVRLKRIFGSRTLSISVLDVTYRFYPDSFSQINLSICPEMLRTAGSLLAQGKNSRLVDLYCGYGFFSCYLAGSFSEIIGVDFAGQSIDSARENMKALRTGAKWSFHSRRVDRRTAESLLPEPGGRECFILDPPRNGTAPGVLETVAARGPELALHVFCGVETIPAELERWRRSGYEPVRCEPLDMFPGTPDVEVMVLLKRVQSVKTSSRSKSGR